jgi:hypothetical protein
MFGLSRSELKLAYVAAMESSYIGRSGPQPASTLLEAEPHRDAVVLLATDDWPDSFVPGMVRCASSVTLVGADGRGIQTAAAAINTAQHATTNEATQCLGPGVQAILVMSPRLGWTASGDHFFDNLNVNWASGSATKCAAQTQFSGRASSCIRWTRSGTAARRVEVPQSQ